jgi:hypothetical protein
MQLLAVDGGGTINIWAKVRGLLLKWPCTSAGLSSNAWNFVLWQARKPGRQSN